MIYRTYRVNRVYIDVYGLVHSVIDFSIVGIVVRCRMKLDKFSRAEWRSDLAVTCMACFDALMKEDAT